MRKSAKRFLSFSAVFLLAAFLCPLGHAQVLYGTLTGNVTDPSGALVPGAKIEALNTGTGSMRNAVSDEHGTYRFTDLQGGQYKVTVKAASFQTVVIDNVVINNNEVR